jgi:type IV secretory pathway VirJ component
MARRSSLVFLLLTLVPAISSAAPDSFKFGRFGTVPVVRPKGEPSQVALLFSDKPGIGAREKALAQALADSGALVFEVDTGRYFATASKGGQHLFPAVDFEALSQIGQKETGVTAYRHPVLVGTGAGAAVAYIALAEAPPNTFTGAVSDGFCAVVPVERRFHRGNGLSWEKKWQGAGVRLLPFPGLENPWLILDNPGAPACAAGPASGFAKEIGSARILPAPAGVAPGEAWKKQLAQALGILAEKRKQEEAEIAARGELKDLPLNEVKPEGAEKDVLAVIVTGSGGYVGFDRKMGNQLASRGVPVVGLSSLAYFWKPRNPDGSSRDLIRILDHYLPAWKKSKVMLVGYSQGADVIPFMMSRMPEKLRSKVALVALIGPDGGMQFDMHPDGWISNRPMPPEIPVAPEVAKLKGSRVLCIYGAEEQKSMCRSLPAGNAVVVEVPGDHGFEGDAGKLAERFVSEIGSGGGAAKKSP